MSVIPRILSLIWGLLEVVIITFALLFFVFSILAGLLVVIWQSFKMFTGLFRLAFDNINGPPEEKESVQSSEKWDDMSSHAISNSVLEIDEPENELENDKKEVLV